MEELEAEEDGLLAPLLAQLSDGGTEVKARLHDIRCRRRRMLDGYEIVGRKRRRKEGDGLAVEGGGEVPALPSELWLHILSFLASRERQARAALVCRHWSWLVLGSIRDGSLGSRRFMARDEQAHRRLQFYARCGPLVSLDLSGWQRVDVGGSVSLRGSSDLVTHQLLCWLPVSLRSLDLADTRVTDVRIAQVASRLTNLTELNVSGTPVSDDGLAVLSSLPRLRKLNVYASGVVGSGFRHLPSSLESIRVSMDTPPEGLSCLPASVRSIQGYVFQDDHIAALPAGLRSLSIFSAGSLSKGAWAALPSSLTRLRAEKGVNGRELAWLPASLTQLRLGSCYLPDVSVSNPLSLPPRLEVLDISLAYATAAQLNALCAALPLLRELSLQYDDHGVDGGGLRHLALLTSLHTLRLRRPTADGRFLAWLPPSIRRLKLTRPELDPSCLRTLPAYVLCQYVGDEPSSPDATGTRH